MILPFSFARPEALVLLLLLPLLIVSAYRSGKRRRALLRRFGQPDALQALSSLNPKRRVRSRLFMLGAIVFLVIGFAGPRWGRGESGVIIGRDLVVVLDFSKSMLADDMRDPDGRDVQERWKAARAGVYDLVESIKQRGGHRMGLVIFAAKPWIVCPLTADYKHFRMRLDEFSPLAPPTELIPEKEEQIPSGTRIGAAIQEAINAHDPRFPGYQVVLLISDGDDPSPDRDSEIETGVRAAQLARVPVHVVGVGDPHNAVVISLKTADGEEELLGPTRMMEIPLKEIARQSHGEYLPARRELTALGEFFLSHVETRPNRELPDDALPQPRDRSLWFLLPAILFLIAAWCYEA